MNEVSIIGLDLAKNIFQAHGAGADGSVVFRRKLSRAQLLKFLAEDPYSGHLFVFRGRRGDLLKIIWWDVQGACLFMKRLERGRFVWPAARDGKVSVTAAQLAMLLEGIDWRMPHRTWRPLQVG